VVCGGGGEVGGRWGGRRMDDAEHRCAGGHGSCGGVVRVTGVGWHTRVVAQLHPNHSHTYGGRECIKLHRMMC
jgi:hypothetical protein